MNKQEYTSASKKSRNAVYIGAILGGAAGVLLYYKIDTTYWILFDGNVVLLVQSILGGVVFGALFGKIRGKIKSGKKAKFVYHLFLLGGFYGFATGGLDEGIFHAHLYRGGWPTTFYETVVYFANMEVPIIEYIYKPGHATIDFMSNIAWKIKFYSDPFLSWFFCVDRFSWYDFEELTGFSVELTHPIIKNTFLWSVIGWILPAPVRRLRKIIGYVGRKVWVRVPKVKISVKIEKRT